MQDIIRRVIDAAGGPSALSRQLNISHTSVYRWTQIPDTHLVKIEEITGIPREELRPDLFEGMAERKLKPQPVSEN